MIMTYEEKLGMGQAMRRISHWICLGLAWSILGFPSQLLAQLELQCQQRGNRCKGITLKLNYGSDIEFNSLLADYRELNQKENIIDLLPSSEIGKDEIPMILIKGGSFWMGSTMEEVNDAVAECLQDVLNKRVCHIWYDVEQPRHEVRLDRFYLDVYEVTNQAFQVFVEATGHRTTAEKEGKTWVNAKGDWPEEVEGASWKNPEGKKSVFVTGRADHPVVSISWIDARDYCEWAGKRLPTEAEWEYAARAGSMTKYWWGNSSPGVRKVENVADESHQRQFPDRRWTIVEEYDDGYERTAPVGTFEPNPWGIYDSGGNVREWVQDWYSKDYYQGSPRENPLGPSKGELKVLRGGSWRAGPRNLRVASRSGSVLTSRSAGGGVRCAKDAS